MMKVVDSMRRSLSEDETAAHVQVERWFDLHVDDIHRFAARRVGHEAASDVTAETFRIALEQFDRFESMRGNERSWLFGIANNLLRRHWRSRRRFASATQRYSSIEDVEVDPIPRLVSQVDAERSLRSVLSAVDELEQDDRDLILLAAWEKLSSSEIGVVLDLPASTVRARLSRVRSLLRSSLEAPL